MKHNIKLARVKSLADHLKGDPRSVFYGDATVSIEPEHVSGAIGHEEAPSAVVEQAIVESTPNEVAAADKIAAYNSMSDAERAARTLLPPLACWNAMVIVNPMLGKVLAKALDYMLLKALNDYPYEGKTLTAVYQGGDDPYGTATVTIDSSVIRGSEGYAHRFIALPFFRFNVAASTLNAAPGAQISVDIEGYNAEGAHIDTKGENQPHYTYSFQRLNSTEAVVGIYIPTTVVATRTLPFLLIAGDNAVTVEGEETATVVRSITITFTGVAKTDNIIVTIPGYSTAELKEISAMYNLPSGMIR